MSVLALALLAAAPADPAAPELPPELARACPAIWSAFDPAGEGLLDGDSGEIAAAADRCANKRAAIIGSALAHLRRSEEADRRIDDYGDLRHAEASLALEVLTPLTAQQDGEAAIVACLAAILNYAQEDAAGFCQDAARLRPRSPLAAMAAGDYARLAEDEPGALAAYEKALALRPRFAAGTARLAAVLVDAGRHGEALSLYLELAALSGKPRFALAAIDIMIDEGREDDARIALDELRGRFPEEPGIARRSGGLALMRLPGGLARTWAVDGRCDSGNPGDFAQILTYLDWNDRRVGEPERFWRTANDRSDMAPSTMVVSEMVRRISLTLGVGQNADAPVLGGALDLAEDGSLVGRRAVAAGPAGGDAIRFAVEIESPEAIDVVLRRRDFGSQDWQVQRRHYAPCKGIAPAWAVSEQP